MSESNFNIFLDLEKLKKRKAKSCSRAQSSNQNRRKNRAQQVRKTKPFDYFNEFEEKTIEFERLLNTLNSEEMINIKILQQLLNIQKTLAEKILILFNNCNLLVNESSINDGASLKSNINDETSQTSLQSQKTNLKDLKVNEEYHDFLNRFTCPLCSKVLKNKTFFIQHLDENCHKENLTSNNDYLPYSYFQILHKNSIKCNICPNSIFRDLSKYFIHFNSKEHKRKSVLASSLKLHTEDLFCSACKILVPNNFIQLNFHMQHSHHLEQKNDEFFIANILKNKFTCLLMKNKTIKCLACSLPFHNRNNFGEFYNHIKETKHLKNLKIMNFDHEKVYCEACSDDINLLEINFHCLSTAHEKKLQKSCCCYFCGDLFFDLNKLAEHMTLECLEIKDLRNNTSLLKNTKETDKIDQASVVESKNIKKKSNSDNSERHLLVKGQENIREVFLFFKKYGEVATVNKLNETTLIVEFYDDKIVEQIMKLKKPICINGVNVEITNDFDSQYLLYSYQKVEESKSDEESDEEKSLSDNENQNEISSFYKLVEEIIPSTFINKQKNFDSEPLIQDCIKTLNCDSCSIVGFWSCGLCGPEDELSLFFDVPKKFFLKLITGDVEYNHAICSVHYDKLDDSKLWKDVIKINMPLPFITCEHKETGKKCNIFFCRSVEKLSHMLRHMINQGENIRYFFLVIKYWFQFNQMKIVDFEYVIISLGLFFLSSQFNVSLPMKFEEIHLKISKFFTEDDLLLKTTNSKSIPFASLEVEDLVLQFLQFFLKFDFEKYAICLPLNFPIPKLILKKLNSSLIKNDPDFSFCIVDPFFQYNIASNFKKDEFKSLLMKLVTKLL